MDFPDFLPPLRDEIARAGLHAKKALGQHFLLDTALLARIVALADVRPGETVYEVGPGPGGLTRALLAAGARVVAVERDQRVLPILERLAAAVRNATGEDRLTVVPGDALAVDGRALAGAGARIVANLPYNVATPLLAGWLSEKWPPWWASATLMFQKEVAERLVAGADTPAYGRLSVLAQARAEARIAMLLPARAFVPPPKVESAVVTLHPRAEGAAIDMALLRRLTGAAFGQRRKMLRQALKSWPEAQQALEALGISAARRAQTLTVADFVSLQSALRRGPADS